MTGKRVNRQLDTLSRRAFCAWAAGLCGAAVVNGPARGIEPIRRDASKFKFSLAAYSYRSLLAGESATMTLFDFAKDCADFGLEGTELTSYYFPSEVDTDYLTRLRAHCFRLGLDVSGTAVGNDFGFPDGPRREQQIHSVKQWIERAAVLGAPVIRIFAGHRHEGIDEQESQRLIVSAIEECCEYAGRHGIHLALENHGGPTETADGLLALVRDVQSPWFGVNLDTGNFRSDDVYHDLARVAPYAINVQVKVTVQSPGGGKQPTDYTRLASLLRDAHYRGYIALEYEESGDVRAQCRHHIEQLREAFGSVV